MHHRKTGCLPRAFDPRIPHYSVLRLAAPPPAIPERIDGWAGLPRDLGIMLNDQLGDCTIAGLHHLRQIGEFRVTGELLTDPDPCVLADYETLCGYVPGNAGTDAGGVMQHVLAGAMQRGLTTPAGSDRILGFVELDPRHPEDIQRCIAECGAAYIGIRIPEAWTESRPGDTWDVPAGRAEGGHCILLTGYDQPRATFDVVSWGMPFTLTQRALVVCDEAYAVIDRSWLRPDGTTLCGLTTQQIMAEMGAQIGAEMGPQMKVIA